MNKKRNKLKYKAKKAIGNSKSYLTKKQRKLKQWKKEDKRNG